MEAISAIWYRMFSIRGISILRAANIRVWVLPKDNNGNYTKFSDAFLEKGDYLRLKNITLGYTLPKHIARYIGLTNGSLRVYVSIDNVATITGYSGIDPRGGQLRS